MILMFLAMKMHAMTAMVMVCDKNDVTLMTVILTKEKFS